MVSAKRQKVGVCFVGTFWRARLSAGISHTPSSLPVLALFLVQDFVPTLDMADFAKYPPYSAPAQQSTIEKELKGMQDEISKKQKTLDKVLPAYQEQIKDEDRLTKE